MASNGSTARKAVEYTWEINNFSCCLVRTGLAIQSPTFVVEDFQGTKWHLWLFPNGQSYETWISFLLRRADDDGPQKMPIFFQRTFISPGTQFLDLPLAAQLEFEKGTCSEVSSMQRMEALFHKQHDVLMIWCRMWTEENCPSESVKYNAVTDFDTEKSVYDWLIYYSDGQWCIKQTGSGNSSCVNVLPVITHDTDNSFDHLTFNMSVAKDKIKAISIFKLYVVDRSGSLKFLVKKEKKGVELKTGNEWNEKIPLNWNDLVCKKDAHSSEDTLLLRGEMITSNGYITRNVIKKVHNGPASTVLYLQRALANRVHSAQDLSSSLQSMQLEGTLCDVTLKVRTRSFPAHRVVLSARSSVFRSMFTADMREKNVDVVPIEDLEEHVVDHLLQYSYTGDVKDLDSDLALKLYYAADKYEMLELRDMCSDYIEGHLTPENVCRVLVLTEMHDDGSLKDAVLDFVSQRRAEILNSTDWRSLEDEKPKLANGVLREICLNR